MADKKEDSAWGEMTSDIRHIKDGINEIKKKLDELNGRVRETERDVAVLQTEQEQLKSQQSRNDWISRGIAIFAATIAAIFGRVDG